MEKGPDGAQDYLAKLFLPSNLGDGTPQHVMYSASEEYVVLANLKPLTLN
jgi:hypothetical protein